MLLGVVSDTHGHVRQTQAAVRMLESLNVEAVLHCGDIGGGAIVDLFSVWPTHFVFGNGDGDVAELRAAIEAAGQTCHGRFGEIELGGTRIALLHSDDAAKFREVTTGDRYGLVCYGHTHVARQEWRGETLVLNPGALYRATPHSIAVVELPRRTVTMVTI